MDECMGVPQHEDSNNKVAHANVKPPTHGSTRAWVARSAQARASAAGLCFMARAEQSAMHLLRGWRIPWRVTLGAHATWHDPTSNQWLSHRVQRFRAGSAGFVVSPAKPTVRVGQRHPTPHGLLAHVHCVVNLHIFAVLLPRCRTGLGRARAVLPKCRSVPGGLFAIVIYSCRLYWLLRREVALATCRFGVD